MFERQYCVVSKSLYSNTGSPIPSPYLVLRDAVVPDDSSIDAYVAELARVLQRHLEAITELGVPASDDELARIELLEKLLHAASELKAHVRATGSK